MDWKAHDPDKKEATTELLPLFTRGNGRAGLPHWPIFQDKLQIWIFTNNDSKYIKRIHKQVTHVCKAQFLTSIIGF